MDINDLRRIRAAAADAMQAAADAVAALEANTETPPTDDELAAANTAFDEAQAAFEMADRKVKRQEAVDAAQSVASQGDTAPAPAGGARQPGAAATAPAAPVNPEFVGADFGLMVQAIGNARGNLVAATDALDAAGHSGISAALSGASEGAGGVMVPRPTAATVIELLRAQAVVRRAGVRTVPLPAGEVRHGRMATGATASYGAENAPAVESEPTFDKVDQSFKTLTALVPIGNALMRHATPQVGALIRDDMVQTMALREDLAFIRGDGTGNTPTGMRTFTPVANVLAAIANDAAAVEVALRTLVSLVEDANVMMVNGGWIMRASTKNFLASLREPTHGSYLFPSIQMDGTLLGYPISTTSQVPNNLGGGGNETEVYFGDFNELMIGDSLSLEISTSTEAAFVDVNGDTISAFQRGLTLMRAQTEHDFAPRHDEALAYLNGVNWSL